MAGERIELPTLNNARDLGGYSSGAHIIKTKRLIRSGALSNLSQHDAQILQRDYALRTVVDFRTDKEREERPDVMIQGVRYIHLPVLNEEVLGITREREQESRIPERLLQDGGEAYMERMYAMLMRNPQSLEHYGEFFDILLEQKEGAILWHCAAGKDRAGIATALVLSALGVEQETVKADYLLTNTYLRPVMEGFLARIPPEHTALANYVRNTLSAKESYFNAAVQAAAEQSGSMDAFLEQKLGLSAEKRKSLRENYLGNRLV